MSARGLLANPALYAGYNSTPINCVEDWIKIAINTGTSFNCFHHHLIYMLESSLTKADRQYFNVLGSTTCVISFLRDKYNLNFYPTFIFHELVNI